MSNIQNQASNAAKATEAKVDQYKNAAYANVHASEARDPSLTLTERAGAAAQYVGDKAKEKGNEMKSDYYNPVDTSKASEVKKDVSETASNAATAAQAKVEEMKAKANAELHSAQAKDPNLPLTDRASAAASYVGDKLTEKTQQMKKEYYNPSS